MNKSSKTELTDGNLHGRLNTLRVTRGWNRSTLARAVSTTPASVMNWEKGNTMPRPDMLERLASALATTALFLRTGEDDEPTLATDKGTRQENFADLIERVRGEVAEAAGLSLGGVRVVLDYGS